MPISQRRLRVADPRLHRAPDRSRRRGTVVAVPKLDTSHVLIAPAHSLTLPSLFGIKSKYHVSYGSENALPLARALLTKGSLAHRHFEGSHSVVEVLRNAMTELVAAAAPATKDEFDIEIRITDNLDSGEARRDCLFFAWGNSGDPQYIPLRPIFERLAGNPYQEALAATLYYWLHQAAWRVFCAFGYQEAESIYGWRKEAYLEARESGEDVDLEGEVESSDPKNVVPYIREAAKLKLKSRALDAALSSIAEKTLRDAFEKSYRLFLISRKIKLPDTPVECRPILDEAAYYMDGDPIPGLCISHWRDDPIVAWFDQFCEEQFNSGVTCRAPIIRCFRPNDTESFLQIVSALPWMAKTVSALGEWVRLAEEMENEYNNRNRRQA